jgi:rod shape-determining protein MreC
MAQLDTAQQTAFFVRGPSPATRLVVFGLLALVLMALDARFHYLTEIRQGFSVMLRPLEIAANAPLAALKYVREYLVLQVNLVEENRHLRLRHLEQQADLQRFELLQQENDHLRKLLGAAQASMHSTKLGEIVLDGRDVFARKVIANLGAQHGVEAGQAVIDEDGVVGQLTQVYPFTSEVTLVTDKELAVPVQVERTGLRAIAFGLGHDNQIGLPYLPTNADIQRGDRLLTSGIDGVYPAGLAVARVVSVERSPDSPFARITCMPVAGVNRHRQVLIVKTQVTEPAGADIQKPETIEAEHAAAKP